MSEKQEWLSSVLPQQLFDLVCHGSSRRKLRLVACGFARNAWPLLTDDRSRRAVAVAEGFADGECDDDALMNACDEAAEVAGAALCRDPKSAATHAARLAVATTLVDAHQAAYVGTLQTPDRYPGCSGFRSEFLEACAAQVSVFRDIYGNPFQSAAINPMWLIWDGGTVPAVAQGIYEESAFARLPILADALEDAGCEDANILTHCRSAGPHVRGCWVLDLLLGKA